MGKAGERARRGVSPGVYFRRRRRRRAVAWTLGTALLIGASVADHNGLGLYHGGDVGRYDGQRFRVVRVVRGDTLDIAAPDHGKPTTRVKLWGVVTPGLDDPRPRGGNQSLAHRAKALTASLVMGKAVELTLQARRPRDPGGRLLAYVHLPGGGVLNARLLKAGLARDDRRRPHPRLARYAKLEYQARSRGIGLWGRLGHKGKTGRGSETSGESRHGP